MLWRDISKILGYFLLCLAVALFIPLGMATYYEFFAAPEPYQQPYSTSAFLATLVICIALALLFLWVGRNSSGNIYRREGLAVVVLIWLVTPAIAALPFWMTGTLANPVQAYFEAASGLTTTGATCMTAKKFNAQGEEIPIKKVWCGAKDTTYVYWGNINPVRDLRTGEIVHEGVEAVGRALLFWRSTLQWLGGMGIILLFAAILPALGVGGKVLFQAELTGPIKGSLTPRLRETASHLWKIYFGWTVLEIILLMVTNEDMKWFDAITISFSTLSTGGFSVRNASIGAYNNSWTEWVVIIFMIVGSINFTLYFYVLVGKFYRIYEPEFILYMIILTLACAFAIPFLFGTPEYLLSGVNKLFDWNDSIRIGIFQILAAGTSTGFSVVNYDEWPYTLQTILIIMSYVGGMSGSTAGGVKVIRYYMLFKIAQYKVESIFRPETVRTFRVGDRSVDSSSTILVLCFFLVVVSISVFSNLIFIMMGLDPETAIGAVSCMLNNTGVAFRMAGPTESFGFLSNFGLIFSVILMVFGRLEYFAVLAVLVPAFWKQK